MIEYWKFLYSIPLILVAVAHVITLCSKSRSKRVTETARGHASKGRRPNDDDDDFNLSLGSDKVSDPLSSGSAESDDKKKRKLGRLFGRKKTTFMDLHDDILLELFKNLPLTDRLQLRRLTRRLHGLEQRAAPVADDDLEFFCFNLDFRVEGRNARLNRYYKFATPPKTNELLLPLDDGIAMLKRVLKCACAHDLDLHIPDNFLDEVFILFPRLDASTLQIKPIISDPPVAVKPNLADYLIDRVRNNKRLYKLKVENVAALMTVQQQQKLLQELRLHPAGHVSLENVSRETVEHLGSALMGLDSSFFAQSKRRTADRLKELQEKILRVRGDRLPKVTADIDDRRKCLCIQLEEGNTYTCIYLECGSFIVEME